jgi:decaprenylphospho-beta-D-erythro-pentofuranosid-2-ulose 2-reductase
VVLLAYGVLGNQSAGENSFAAAREVFDVNFTSAASWITQAAHYFEMRREGCLAVITSVAGDRARASHYIYGAAKGGLGFFLEGVRLRLQGTGVRVVTIKPGFVDTPMTAHLPKSVLFARPETVARDIVRALDGKNGVIYTPWWWRIIMGIICAIPEPLFRRLKL